MAASVEVFGWPEYHGAELHIRVGGAVLPVKLSIAIDGVVIQEIFSIPDVSVVKLKGLAFGESYSISATLTDSSGDTTGTKTLQMPELESLSSGSDNKFKDFWIAIGQPGAYTTATTFVDGLGVTHKYYERVIGLWNDFHIRVKHTPYSLMSKLKNIVVQSWKDEDGDDILLPRIQSSTPGVYIPQPIHEAVELQPTFVIFENNSVYDANALITQLKKAIEGRWLKIWDEYTRIGYEGVVLIDVDDDPKFKRRNYDYVEFTMKFKVNGPNIDAPFEGIN